MSEFILYQTEDGKPEVRLRAEDGSVWLTQGEIAELFATTKQNVSLHAANVLKEGELDEPSVVKESLTTAADGKNYRTKLYRLEMILAVGYRVKGPRGTQFRQWATAHLADWMRRMGICEEKSSGIDRVVQAAEFYQLPAPDFRVSHRRTMVALFGPKPLEDMDRNDRIRACFSTAP